jgi:hypothetical protein
VLAGVDLGGESRMNKLVQARLDELAESFDCCISMLGTLQEAFPEEDFTNEIKDLQARKQILLEAYNTLNQREN